MIAPIRDALPLLLNGLWWTVWISGVSIACATVIGTVVGVLRTSTYRIIRGATTVYVNVFRCTPILVQLLFVYFGIPQLLHISWSPTAGIVTLSLNVGAYISEVVRSGIESIDPGQMEAGRAVGLTKGTTMRLIVLPQAARRVIAPYINQCTILVKDSSLLSVIGVTELTQRGDSIYSVNFKAFQILFAMGVLYFAVNYILGRAARVVERKIAVT